MPDTFQPVASFISDFAHSSGLSVGSLIGYAIGGIILIFTVLKYSLRATKWTALTTARGASWGFRKAFPKPSYSVVCQELLTTLEGPAVYGNPALLCSGAEFGLINTEMSYSAWKMISVSCGGDDVTPLLSDKEKEVVEKRVKEVVLDQINKENNTKREVMAARIARHRSYPR